MAEEKGEIVFWTLRQKFIDSSSDLPERSRQVMYYSLAIGHHVGVIDCLKQVLSCPIADYRAWVAQMEDEQAKRKMQGVFTFGEIVIDVSHAAMLRRALAPLADDKSSPWQMLSINFIHLLDEMVHEPAIYLMTRRID